jgi:putative flavoprotein involved in K+ transport
MEVFMKAMIHRYDTIVIGAGQAGLATGYYLKQQGQDFLILEANERIGDSWRARWDSLRLFTPARYDSLPGMPFPAAPDYFPPKNEMADYLESYAAHFDLPVQSGVWVERLTRTGERFLVTAGAQQFEADNVVVAMSTYQVPWIPSFAEDLNPDMVQIHSADYQNPDQLQEGGVLIVGAGNSGSEIGMEVAKCHATWMSGRDVGHIPFRIETRLAQLLLIPFVIRFLYHRVMTVNTPIGRKARPKKMGHSGPLIRVKPKDMAAVGIRRVPKMMGVQNGLPVMENGRCLDVANVIWCTGYRPNFSWIDLPIFGSEENPQEPVHKRGIVVDEPGLYFTGLFFLYALTSSLVTGVGRDARYIAQAIAKRSSEMESKQALSHQRGAAHTKAAR